MININVKTLKTIPVDEFLSYEFNNLKDENRNVNKLVHSIKTNGWNFPVFIWEGHKYVIDGKGRKLALEKLIEEGETIEGIPVVEISAKDLDEAKHKVLEVSSQYGDITAESFYDFIEDMNIDYDSLEIKYTDLGNTDMLNTVNKGSENDEWVGMPDFDSKDNEPKIIIRFENEEYRDEFVEEHKLQFSKKERMTWSTNYPFKDRDDLSSIKYE